MNFKDKMNILNMTKNKSGGNKQKSQARKFVQNKNTSVKLRLVENDCEKYAIVKKLLGNGRCLVHTIDNVEKNCIIRGKFRGRKKRDNILTVGSWILVDVREWQSDNSQDCDLLEIYSDNEKDKLKDLNINWTILTNNDLNISASFEHNKTSDIHFMDANEEEYNNIMELDNTKFEKEEYEYNIDDI
jgi:initiation factor 1A